VSGNVILPPGHAVASVCVGAFKTPIVQYRPASARVFSLPPHGGPHVYELGGIPRGEWFVHAIAVADSIDPEPWTRRVALVDSVKLTVTGSDASVCVNISPRHRRPTDLPILFAMPELEAMLDTSSKHYIYNFQE
jgi:hypothetical protein